jgi:DNA-binding GntR family transcriptional regulator
LIESDEMQPSKGLLTAHETVYRTLRGNIAAGKLRPGSRLVQRQLAQQMGTSTIPVIDALRRLEGEGLLVTTPGIGTHVRGWQPHEVEEVYLLRASLEGVACRLFVTRARTADFAALDAYDQAFESAVAQGSLEGCRASDERLHMHIASAGRSAELLRLISNSSCVLLTIDNTLLPPERRDSGELGPPGIHGPLVRALRSGDPERAEQQGREHVIDGFHRIEPYLERLSGPCS